MSGLRKLRNREERRRVGNVGTLEPFTAFAFGEVDLFAAGTWEW